MGSIIGPGGTGGLGGTGVEGSRVPIVRCVVIFLSKRRVLRFDVMGFNESPRCFQMFSRRVCVFEYRETSWLKGVFLAAVPVHGQCQLCVHQTQGL